MSLSLSSSPSSSMSTLSSMNPIHANNRTESSRSPDALGLITGSSNLAGLTLFSFLSVPQTCSIAGISRNWNAASNDPKLWRSSDKWLEIVKSGKIEGYYTQENETELRQRYHFAGNLPLTPKQLVLIEYRFYQCGTKSEIQSWLSSKRSNLDKIEKEEKCIIDSKEKIKKDNKKFKIHTLTVISCLAGLAFCQIVNSFQDGGLVAYSLKVLNSIALPLGGFCSAQAYEYYKAKKDHPLINSGIINRAERISYEKDRANECDKVIDYMKNPVTCPLGTFDPYLSTFLRNKREMEKIEKNRINIKDPVRQDARENDVANELETETEEGEGEEADKTPSNPIVSSKE